MKRWTRSAVVLAAIALLAAGCGAGNSGGGGNVTLRYAYWGPNQTPAMQQIASEFEKANPSIKVQLELTPYSQYWTKLQTATSGGEAPDVFWINATYFPLYASNRKLLSLDDWKSSADLDLAKYPATVVDLYKWGGKQYAFPKDFDTVGLWYNKALFKAAGVAPPNANWTWDDVVVAAKKLTDPNKGTFGIAAKLDPQVWYYNVVPQAGGYIVDREKPKSGYDSPGAIKALQWTSDLINKHHVSPTLGQMSETDPRKMFQSGKVAMIYDGSFAAVELYKNPYTRQNADVAVLPAGPAKRASVIHGVGQAISADTEHPAEAQKFVQFLVGKTGARIQGETGTTLPSLQDGQQAWLASMPEFHLQAFLDELPHTYPYPTSKNASKWQAFEKELLPKAWTGEQPAAQVGTELATKMDEVLAQERR